MGFINQPITGGHHPVSSFVTITDHQPTTDSQTKLQILPVHRFPRDILRIRIDQPDRASIKKTHVKTRFYVCVKINT